MWIGIGIAVAVLGIWYIGTYNSFRSLDIKIEEALSGIDVALTKRFDTLTKMWDLAKKYMKHEEGTLTKVVELRQKNSGTLKDAQELSDEMTKLQAGLNVVVEQYPDLKSNQTIQEVQQASFNVEEHLQAARRLYNSNVSIYNQKMVMFPSSIVAGIISATKKDFFEAEASKREDVKFD
ncbi:LemA family protein [Mycoplasmatota bacterium]|nr:LemA family protein [Mycoplasmatota bacterium]